MAARMASRTEVSGVPRAGLFLVQGSLPGAVLVIVAVDVW